MKKVNVQMLFTEEEYYQIEEKANKFGLTVPLYIRSQVLDKDSFGYYYSLLIDKVGELPKGQQFNIRTLFGIEWINIPKGIKLNLGKIFFGKVESKAIDNVHTIGKDSSNIMWYEKL